MKVYKLTFLAAIILFLGSCSKDEESVDTTYPVIDIASADASPKQCAVVKKGEKLAFIANLSDNAALGSVSIDIHHNFDHHTHSTEVESCNMDPIKAAVKPFLLIKNFTIPEGVRQHKVSEEIQVPSDIDAGDYHFLIRVTDKEGWQTIKGLSIKIVE